MKLFLGKKLVTKALNKALDITSIHDVLSIAAKTQQVEEQLITMTEAYYKANKAKVIEMLNTISEDDLQKGHDMIMKALSFRPVWDADLNVTVTFDKEEA